MKSPRQERPRSRDKERTKKAFLDATIELIREVGFEGLGVNAIAERAGASKVLIYRYFGGLDGLFREVAEALDPAHSGEADRAMTMYEEGKGLAELMRMALLQMHRDLKVDDLAKQLMVWELSHQNTLTRVFAEARERAGLQMTKRFWEVAAGERRLPGFDPYALFAVLAAGVSYLTLRSDSVAEYNGVNIQSPEGWNRMADAVSTLMALAEGRALETP